MTPAEIDGASAGNSIAIGTWTGGTYPGDHFIFWSWVRPIAGAQFTNGYIGLNNAFSLLTGGSDTFAPTNCGASTPYCNASASFPTAFGTQLAYNGWYPQVSIATIATGESTSHNIVFNLTAGAHDAAGQLAIGNQFAQPGWTFIPGPNNPACTAAGTCTLTATDIESARQDHYHGCVPPNQSAGAVVTCEASSSGTEVKVNGGSALTTSNQTGVLPYLCADTSGSGTAQSCTTTPTFRAPRRELLVLYHDHGIRVEPHAQCEWKRGIRGADSIAVGLGGRIRRRANHSRDALYCVLLRERRRTPGVECAAAGHHRLASARRHGHRHFGIYRHRAGRIR